MTPVFFAVYQTTEEVFLANETPKVGFTYGGDVSHALDDAMAPVQAKPTIEIHTTASTIADAADNFGTIPLVEDVRFHEVNPSFPSKAAASEIFETLQHAMKELDVSLLGVC